MKIPFPKYEAEVVEEIEAYLDMDYQTEITQTSEDEYGLKYLFARGFNASDREGTRNLNNYARPMIQPIPDGAFSGTGKSVTPCQCDRFDRSWNCEIHPPIDWDPVRRRWKRPCTGDRARCSCDPCHERRRVRRANRSNGLRPPQGLIDPYLRQVELYSQAVRPVEPLLRIRDSDHSYEATVLRDSREMQEAVLNQARAEALRAGWPVRGQVLGRSARIHADGSLIFEPSPEEIGRYARGFWENGQGLVPTRNEERRRRDTWASRLEALQDATITVNLEGTFDPSVIAAALQAPRTLEIESETEQGAGPLAIEVEPSDGSTPAP